ncbi:hypothetical protein MGN01_29680 [Methylobacterium gnaphalii]|uniref:Uncharacterized protein n=1 Tax=Methylobacterium gnaphalii TaxID=1010610 RepID=A0A512JMR2_9HYPH|nr:hypothetical protein MGN01_29680 [Methylobacterium gnaphalii]GLS50401.1 hypothetical protein GCM10007885_32530 [Methylobacterium gnaphalii]
MRRVNIFDEDMTGAGVALVRRNRVNGKIAAELNNQGPVTADRLPLHVEVDGAALFQAP